MSEPHPEARLAPDRIPWLGTGVEALPGLTIGAESFAAALVGASSPTCCAGEVIAPCGAWLISRRTALVGGRNRDHHSRPVGLQSARAASRRLYPQADAGGDCTLQWS